ncbi:hypothetical protein F750_5264 [Streptomyces sp. PAMC 26508]|nr:hypothetical protein F750_5264 [Streptomyces sp. PAMC 26508]
MGQPGATTLYAIGFAGQPLGLDGGRSTGRIIPLLLSST